MRPAASPDSFVRAPVGTWAVAGTSLLWCASTTLCGVVCWGKPGADDARDALRLYEGMAQLAPQFDIVLDAGALEAIDPAALTPFMAWVGQHLDELSRRIRRRVGIVPAGIPGLTLAGITPALGGPGPYTLVTTTREALGLLLPDTGGALCVELEALTLAARGGSLALLELRALLAANLGRLDLDQAAHRLRKSGRTLQRELAACDSSYRAEQQRARFRAVEARLAGTDKLTAIAHTVGLTENGLTALVRAHTGLTPGAYRRKLRG
ncbi:MAG: helix-turn-helix transcriptional regulator [Deltaproteobacteria bacterium]|nr:helix-turn-helix transcriptional regulator [Deltaproteobacteria bacterium]